MSKLNTAFNISRTGQTSSKIRNRPDTSPPVHHIGFTGRPTRNWHTYNHQLSNRYMLSSWLPTSIFLNGTTGSKGGNQKTYRNDLIETICMVKILFNLPLRGVLGLIKDYFQQQHLTIELPHYSTLSRRMRQLQLTIDSKRGTDFAVDSTGIGVNGTGEYYNHRFKTRGKFKYRKLHVVTDLDTGFIVNAAVTRSYGTGTADHPVGVKLVGKLGRIGSVSADKAYDSEQLYRLCVGKGGRLLCPPKNNSVYSKDPDSLRNITKHQIGKLGEEVWRERSGYGYRSLVENVFSVLKRCLGGRCMARSWEGQVVEVGLKCMVYNRWVVEGMVV